MKKIVLEEMITEYHTLPHILFFLHMQTHKLQMLACCLTQEKYRDLKSGLRSPEMERGGSGQLKATMQKKQVETDP